MSTFILVGVSRCVMDQLYPFVVVAEAISVPEDYRGPRFSDPHEAVKLAHKVNANLSN